MGWCSVCGWMAGGSDQLYLQMIPCQGPAGQDQHRGTFGNSTHSIKAGKWREGGVKEEGRTCSLVISCFVTSFAEVLGSYAESV